MIENAISKLIKSYKCIDIKSVVIPKSVKNPSPILFKPVFISILIPIDSKTDELNNSKIVFNT